MKGVGRPESVADLLSSLEARVRSLEVRRSLSLGPWVLELSDDGSGALLARHAPSGVVRVVAPGPEPEQVPPPPPPGKHVDSRRRPGRRVGQTRT